MVEWFEELDAAWVAAQERHKVLFARCRNNGDLYYGVCRKDEWALQQDIRRAFGEKIFLVVDYSTKI